VFNVCYVLAIAVAALLAPPTGVAPLLIAVTAGVYLLGLLAHDRVLRRARRRTEPDQDRMSGPLAA
jgi:Sec-independent protein secretion pathway component TatC